MLSVIHQIALKNPNQLFSINPNCTYLELDRLVQYITSKLDEYHIENQLLLVPAQNTLEHIIIAFACIRANVVYAPINNSISDDQINEIIDKYDIHYCYGINSKTIKKNITLIDLNFKNYDPKLVYFNKSCNIDETKLATITFTSGSTGIPKAVAHCLKAHIANAKGSSVNIPINKDSRYLLSLPIFHIGGFAILIKTILGNGTIIFPTQNIEEAIINYKATHLSLVPTQIYRLIKSGFNFKNSQVKYLLIGGASISSDLLNSCFKANIEPFISYGMSEMASQICTIKVQKSKVENAIFGEILPFREIAISQQGEILVKGETLFLGYYNGKNIQPSTDENGFFHTRDLGMLCTKGNKQVLSVIGRLDNQFISGGENIQPEEIERIILSNIAISECIVIGVPDPEWGNKTIALVETELTKAQLLDFCKQKMCRHQVPKEFYYFSQFTINTQFKIKRKDIVRYYIAHKESLLQIT